MLIFSLAASLAAQVPQAVTGVVQSPVVERAPQHDARFEFHSSFWLNLHLAIYEQSRQKAGLPVMEGGGADQGAVRAMRQADWGASEKSAWDAAVSYYAANIAQHDLLFDSNLAEITQRLALLEDCPDISGRTQSQCASGLKPDFVAVLEAAAPGYRAHEWPAQDRRNRIWVACVAPLVRELSASLSRNIAAAYQSDWPARALRVDIAGYAGPFGAYTTLDPPRLTISSEDPRNQGFSGFETLFHEASHVLAGKVQELIASDCRELQKPIPRDLWHALIFYTTGVLVERALQSGATPVPAGAQSYVPYAEKYGLYERGWQGYDKLLKNYWQPYLDGKTPFGQAVEALVTNQ